jgi:putative flavoprotein involved in K+ transport
MARTSVVIIGAGQAGLAMSRSLSDLDIEHVVLERGSIAQRWRSHGWDSLRLLTPNWMTRLPGFRYDGHDPDGFMGVPELVSFFQRYAVLSGAPIVTDAAVQRVEPWANGFRVQSSRGLWRAQAVVVATGYAEWPLVPAIGRGLSPGILQVVPAAYRNPSQLPSGGVLIVGSSSTGVQLADEIQKTGRQVTLAVGRHTRLPRSYRGRDILWWLDRLGALTEPIGAVRNIRASLNQPSLQLVGRPDHAALDLRALHQHGVRLVGRIRGIDGMRVHLADDLVAKTAAADIKMAETLRRIDSHIEKTGVEAEPREPFEPTWPLAAGAPTDLDLEAAGIATTIWATGYRRSYPWLRLPVLDARGEIIHEGGVTPVPGLYVLGLRFQRRRSSNFIHGVGSDARDLADHVAGLLSVRQPELRERAS